MITFRILEEHIVMAKLSDKKVMFRHKERNVDLEFVRFTQYGKILVSLDMRTSGKKAYKILQYHQNKDYEIYLK